jgi:hypothetical protein
MEDRGIPNYGSIAYYAPTNKTTPSDFIATVIPRFRNDAAEYYMGDRFPCAADTSKFQLTTIEMCHTEISSGVAGGCLYVPVAHIKLIKDGNLRHYVPTPDNKEITVPVPKLGRCGKIQHIYLFQDEDDRTVPADCVSVDEALRTP